MKRFYIIGFLILMSFDTLSQISFKYASTQALPLELSPDWLMRLFLNPWLYGAIAGYLGAFVTWMTLLRYAPVGPSFAASHLELISVTLFSVWLFNEPLNAYKILGGVLILLGVLCLAKDEKDDEAGEAEAAPSGPENKMRELPPTAGLPMHMGDCFRAPEKPFTAGLRDWLGIPEPIMACSAPPPSWWPCGRWPAAIRAGAASSSRPTPARSSRWPCGLPVCGPWRATRCPEGLESIPARSGAAAMKPRSPWSPRIWAAGLRTFPPSPPWPMPMEPS